MSNINDLIEQAKDMDDPAKIVEVSKVCGLDISEAEAKAFVDTKELPDSVMDAIAGGSGKDKDYGKCPECGAPLTYIQFEGWSCTSCSYYFLDR